MSKNVPPPPPMPPIAPPAPKAPPAAPPVPAATAVPQGQPRANLLAEIAAGKQLRKTTARESSTGIQGEEGRPGVTANTSKPAAALEVPTGPQVGVTQDAIAAQRELMRRKAAERAAKEVAAEAAKAPQPAAEQAPGFTKRADGKPALAPKPGAKPAADSSGKKVPPTVAPRQGASAKPAAAVAPKPTIKRQESDEWEGAEVEVLEVDKSAKKMDEVRRLILEVTLHAQPPKMQVSDATRDASDTEDEQPSVAAQARPVAKPAVRQGGMDLSIIAQMAARRQGERWGDDDDERDEFASVVAADAREAEANKQAKIAKQETTALPEPTPSVAMTAAVTEEGASANKEMPKASTQKARFALFKHRFVISVLDKLDVDIASIKPEDVKFLRVLTMANLLADDPAGNVSKFVLEEMERNSKGPYEELSKDQKAELLCSTLKSLRGLTNQFSDAQHALEGLPNEQAATLIKEQSNNPSGLKVILNLVSADKLASLKFDPHTTAAIIEAPEVPDLKKHGFVVAALRDSSDEGKPTIVQAILDSDISLRGNEDLEKTVAGVIASGGKDIEDEQYVNLVKRYVADSANPYHIHTGLQRLEDISKQTQLGGLMYTNLAKDARKAKEDLSKLKNELSVSQGRGSGRTK